MDLTEIVLHVDDSPRCEARLAAGLAVASRHGARLVGAFVKTPPQMYNFEVPSRVLDDFMAQLEAQTRTKAADAEKRFRARVDAAGVASDWRVLDGETTGALAVCARYADLVIVGQTPPDAHRMEGESDVPEQLLLSGSAPVLIVPHYGTFEAPGGHVLVAWDASAAAARAVRDALPLLARADRVTVLSVNPERTSARHGEVPGADIALHLARHGVTAETSVSYSDEIGVGDMILSRAADLGADMLVMGGYGHARLREVLLGGVTRQILGHMTVPTLMSH